MCEVSEENFFRKRYREIFQQYRTTRAQLLLRNNMRYLGTHFVARLGRRTTVDNKSAFRGFRSRRPSIVVQLT